MASLIYAAKNDTCHGDMLSLLTLMEDLCSFRNQSTVTPPHHPSPPKKGSDLLVALHAVYKPPTGPPSIDNACGLGLSVGKSTMDHGPMSGYKLVAGHMSQDGPILGGVRVLI